MAILDIVELPDPLLKEKSQEVTEVDEKIKKLMEDMLETMYQAPGIGLAAPQVGVLKRVIVFDVSREEEENEPFFMANPEVVWQSEEENVYSEGCLSVPKQYADVVRPKKVRVKYIDKENKIREDEFDGMYATVVQHEIDHLDGVLFVDHLSRLKKNMVIKKMKKYQKEREMGLYDNDEN